MSYDFPINGLARYVSEWADMKFPNRTDASMFLKLFSEIGELVDDPDDPDELADVFIMLLDYAHRKKIDLGAAVMNKLTVNNQRTWTETSPGVFRHVK